MTDRTLREKAKSLAELNAQINALEKQAAKLKADITEEMETRSADELKIGNFLARWKPITSLRFDTKLFKEAHETLYEQYTKVSESRRFTLSAA